MSYMRGDLLTRTRKLVKGLAIATPVWLKAMEAAPPVKFPRTDGNIKKIELPEDAYVKKFFKKHPDSLYHDAIKICGFDPPPARVFAWRVLELKAQGVSDEVAMGVADMEYRAEKKEKQKAYKELKNVCRLQGKKLPPNPYPSAIKEIQAEEKKFVRARFFDPKTLEIVQKMKEEKAAEMQDRDQQRGFSSGGNNRNNFVGRPGSIVGGGFVANGNGVGGEFGGGFGGRTSGMFGGRTGGFGGRTGGFGGDFASNGNGDGVGGEFGGGFGGRTSGMFGGRTGGFGGRTGGFGGDFASNGNGDDVGSGFAANGNFGGRTSGMFGSGFGGRTDSQVGGEFGANENRVGGEFATSDDSGGGFGQRSGWSNRQMR